MDRKTGELVENLPLRERFPDYLRAFALGVAITAAVGLVLWQLTSFTLEHAIGYTWLFTGVLLWLVGGARGGGYTNLSLGAQPRPSSVAATGSTTTTRTTRISGTARR